MIVAIYGSPRKGGNTEILLDAFLRPVQEQEEVRRFRLGEMKLQPCIACGHCKKTGRCIFEDEIAALYDTIDQADGLVIASPIFFTNVSAQAKAFIDRAQAAWERQRIPRLRMEPRPGRKGFFLAAGAMKTELFMKSARMVIKSLMHTLEIPCTGDLFFQGVDEKGAIRNVPGALEQAEAAGKAFLLPADAVRR